MRKLFVAGIVAALSIVGFVANPARADVTVCHDVSISIADEAIVDAGCNTIPTDLPEAP